MTSNGLATVLMAAKKGKCMKAIKWKAARLRRAVAALAVSASLVGAALAVTASPAAAEVPTKGYAQNVENRSPEDGLTRCLDDSSLGIRAIACNGLPYQLWDINYFADGSYEFVNHATGNCLDGLPTGYPDAPMHGVPCNGGWSGYQKWMPVGSWGYRNLLQNEATGLCLDFSLQFGVREFTCSWPASGFNYFQSWFEAVH